MEGPIRATNIDGRFWWVVPVAALGRVGTGRGGAAGRRGRSVRGGARCLTVFGVRGSVRPGLAAHVQRGVSPPNVDPVAVPLR